MGKRGPKPIKAEAIALSALALFVERGVKGATTREIAKRARTTEGSLYRYYASKDDLARRVLTSCLVGFGESIASSLEKVAGPRGRLHSFIRAYLEYAKAHPLEHAFICQSNFQKMVGVPDEILRPRRILIDILSDGIAAGEFAHFEPRLVAPFITGGLSRACPMPGEPRGEGEWEDAISVLCTNVERMVISPHDSHGMAGAAGQ